MNKRLINSTVAYPLIFSVILLDITPRPVFANQPQHTLSGIAPVAVPYKKEAEKEKPAEESSQQRQQEMDSTGFTMERNTLTPPDDEADSGQKDIAFKPFKASAKLYPQGNQEISLKVSENYSAELIYNGKTYTGRYDHDSGKVIIQSTLSSAEKRSLSSRSFELTVRKGEEPTIASFSEKTIYRINTQKSELIYQFDEKGDVQKFTSLYRGENHKSSSENSYSYTDLENGERKVASMTSSSYSSSLQWTAYYESSYRSKTSYEYEIIAGKALTTSTIGESSSRSVYNKETSIYSSQDKYFQSYDENGRPIASATVYESTSNQSGYQETYTNSWYQFEDAGTFTRKSSNANVMGSEYLSGVVDIKSAIAFTDEMSVIQTVEHFSDASMAWDKRLYSVEYFKEKDPVTGEEMFAAKRVDFPWDSVNQKSMSAIVVGEVDKKGGEKNDILFENHHETTINGKVYSVSYGLNRRYDAANGAGFTSKRPYYEFSEEGEYGLVLNHWSAAGSETIVWDILSEKTKIIDGVEYGWEFDAEGHFRVNKNTVDHKQIAIDKAIADLVDTLDLSDGQRSRIRVVSAEQMTWNDGSLGFPVPGENYTMATENGWRVVLEFGMNTFAYHKGLLDPAKKSALTAMKHLRDENWIDLEKIKIESARFEYSNADSDKTADVWQTPVHRIILSTGSDDQAEKWLYRVDYLTQEILSLQSTSEVLEKAIQEIRAKMDAFGIEAPVDAEKLSEAYSQIDGFAEVMREMLMALKRDLDNLGWGQSYYYDDYYGYDYYAYDKPAAQYGIWAWPGVYPAKAKSLESEVIAFLNQTHTDLVNADVRITGDDGISVVVPMAELIKIMREMINTVSDDTMTTVGSADSYYYYYGGGMYIYDPSELLPVFKGLAKEMLPDYFSQPKNYAHSISVFQFFYYAMIAHMGPTDQDLQGIIGKFLQPNIGRLVNADGQLDRARFKELLKTGKLYDNQAERLRADLIAKTDKEIEAAKGFIADYELQIKTRWEAFEKNIEQLKIDIKKDVTVLHEQRAELRLLAESSEISDASRAAIKELLVKMSAYLDADANGVQGKIGVLLKEYEDSLRSYTEIETGFIEGMIAAEQDFIESLSVYRQDVSSAETMEELEKLSKNFPVREVFFRPAIDYVLPQHPREVTRKLMDEARTMIAKVKEEIKNLKIENLIAEAERKIRAIHNSIDIATPISEDALEEMHDLMKNISDEVRNILVKLKEAIDVIQNPPQEDGGMIFYNMWGYGPPKAVELENLANELMNKLYAAIMTSDAVIETRSGESLILPIKSMVEILNKELQTANVGIWSMEENYLVLKGLNKEIVGEFHPRGGHLYNVFQMMMYSLAYGPSQEDLLSMMIRFARAHDGLIMTDGKLDLVKFREVLVHGNLKDPGNRLIVNYSGGKAYIDWNPDEPGKLVRTDIESGESVEFVEARDVMSCSYPANGPAMCAGIAFPGEGFEQVGSYKKYLPFGGYEDRIIFGRRADYMPERVFLTESEKEIFASLELMKFSDVSFSKEDKTHSYMFETKAPGVVEFRVTKSCAAPAGTACKPAVKTFTIRLQEGIATFAPVVIDVQGSSLEHIVPAPGSFTFSNIPADTEFISASEKAEPRQRTHQGYLREMPQPSTLQRTAFSFAVIDSKDWNQMNFVMDGVIPEGIADLLRHYTDPWKTVELTFSKGMTLEGQQLHVVEKINGESVEFLMGFHKEIKALEEKAKGIHDKAGQLPAMADANKDGKLDQKDLDMLQNSDASALSFLESLGGIISALESKVSKDSSGHAAKVLAMVQGYQANVKKIKLQIENSISEVRQAIELEESRQKAIEKARELLTEALALDESQKESIRVVSSEMQTWTNGCVGFSVPGQMCTMAIVNGWRVVLEFGLNEFAFHAGRIDPSKKSAITAMKHFSEKTGTALEKIAIDSSAFESDGNAAGGYYYDPEPAVHRVMLSTVSGNHEIKGSYRVDYPTQEILSFEIKRPASSLREALLNLHGENADIRIFQEVPQACTNGIPSSCWGEVTYFAAPSNYGSFGGDPAETFKAGLYTARYSYVQSPDAAVVYSVSDSQPAESVTLAGTIKELSGPSILMRSAFVFSYKSNTGTLGGADAAAPALTVDGVQPEGIAEFLRPYSESGGMVKLTLSYSFELSGIHLFETLAINGESPEVLSVKMKIEKFARQYAADPLDITGDGIVNDLDVKAVDEGFQMILKYGDLLNAEQTGIFDLNQDGVVDANDQRLAREKIQGHIKQNDERQALIAYIQGVNERSIAYVEFLKEQMSMILGVTIAVSEEELPGLIEGLSEAEGKRFMNLHMYYRAVQAIAEMVVSGEGDVEKLFEEFPEVFTMYGEIQEAFAAFMASENLEIQFLEVVAVYETEGKTMEELREIAAMIQEAFGGDANQDGKIDLSDVEHVLNNSKTRVEEHTARTLENFARINAEFEALRDYQGERAALIAYIEGVNELSMDYAEKAQAEMQKILGVKLSMDAGELARLIADSPLSGEEGKRLMKLHIYYRAVQAFAEIFVSGAGDIEKLFEEFPDVFTMYGEIREEFMAFMNQENLEFPFLERVAAYETEGKTLEELREIAEMLKEAFGGDANQDGKVDLKDAEYTLSEIFAGVRKQVAAVVEDLHAINKEFETLRDGERERSSLIAYIQGVNERSIAYVEFLKEQMSMILGVTIAVSEEELPGLIEGLSEAEGKRFMNLHMYYRAVQAIAEMVVSGEGDVEKLFEEFPEVFTMYGEIQEAFAAFMESENLEIQFLEVVAVYETEGKTLEELREIVAMIKEAFGGDANQDGKIDLSDVEHVLNQSKANAKDITESITLDLVRINQEFRNLKNGNPENKAPVIQPVQDISVVPANVDFPITGNPQIAFNLSVSDPENDAVTLSMTFEPAAASSLFYNIPPAPAFDAAAGTFRWQPSARDVGEYKVTFHAVDALGNASSTTMTLEVKSPAICNSNSTTCKNLKAWELEGTAAGSNARYEVVDEDGTTRIFNGVTYVNRDGRHAWKGDNSLTQQVRVVTGWAAPYSPVLGVVAAISNSSTSGSTPMSDNIGSFLSSQWGAQTNVNLARNNNLHFSPEHRSHDAGTNYGDAHLGQTALGHIVSQGSSGSEGSMPQYAQQAVAAMNSEVQQALAENGMMTRALQMLFRKNINGNTEEDYFTGKAHPRAFAASSINGTSLVQDAHDLKYGELPADIGFEIVSHNLNEDSVNLPNTDKETQIYNTREAGAFVHRGLSYYSEFVVRPNVNHYDGAETDVEFVVTATRGEAEITRQDDGNYLVRIPYQNRQPVLPGSNLDSNRVDIMITTDSGAPPAFISVNTAANEKRIYDEETKKIQRIEYSKNYWQHSIVGSNVSYDSADFHYEGEVLTGFTLNRGAEAFKFTADGKLIEAVDVSGRAIQARNIKFEVAPSGTFKNLMVAVIQPEVFHFEYTADGYRRIKHIDTLDGGKVVRRDRYEYNNSNEVSRVQILSVDISGAEILSAILTPQENGLARITTPDEAFSILVEFSGFMPVLRSNTNFLPYLIQLSLIGQISARENNMDPDSLVLSEIYFSDPPASEPYQGYLGNLQARFMNADKTLNLWGYSWTKRNFPQDLFPDYPEQTGFQIAYSVSWPYSFYDYSASGAFMGRHEQDHEDRVRAMKIVEARFRADYPGVENPIFKITRSLSQDGGWEGNLSADKPSPDRNMAGGYEISVEDTSGNVKMTYEIQKRYSGISDCAQPGGCYNADGTYYGQGGILWRLFEDSEMPERFEEYQSNGSLTARRDLILDANSEIQGIESYNADGVLVSMITFSSPVTDMSGTGKAIVKMGEAAHELTFASIHDLLDQLNLLENLKA